MCPGHAGLPGSGARNFGPLIRSHEFIATRLGRTGGDIAKRSAAAPTSCSTVSRVRSPISESLPKTARGRITDTFGPMSNRSAGDATAWIRRTISSSASAT